MQLKELTDYLESIAPLQYQESYDNAGLIVGSHETEIKGVLISLDTTPEVIKEAVEIGANVVVAHHPIIFSGLKKINGKTYIEKTIIDAIQNNIAIYAIHTNLDNIYVNGVNAKIAEKLGLAETKILAPKLDVDPSGSVGSGMIGQLKKPLSEIDFLDYLKDKMGLKVVKHTTKLSKTVKTVAVCGGSGGFLLPNAIAAGADVFITADYKYHEFFDANGQIVIIDIGHYESERYTIDLLYKLITEKFSNFAAHSTNVDTNPIKYH